MNDIRNLTYLSGSMQIHRNVLRMPTAMTLILAMVWRLAAPVHVSPGRPSFAPMTAFSATAPKLALPVSGVNLVLPHPALTDATA